MINEQALATFVQQEIANKGHFLVHFSVDGSNQIKVVLDTVEGIRLEQITAVSRAIERNLYEEDEEMEFQLTVTSPGVGEPLLVAEQYQQNLNRKLSILTHKGEELEGRLVAFKDQELTLEWKTREPKPVGKGKTTVTKQQKIEIDKIAQARVQVEFK
jgi:ribosome maturation factor RimP